MKKRRWLAGLALLVSMLLCSISFNAIAGDGYYTDPVYTYVTYANEANPGGMVDLVAERSTDSIYNKSTPWELIQHTVYRRCLIGCVGGYDTASMPDVSIWPVGASQKVPIMG